MEWLWGARHVLGSKLTASTAKRRAPYPKQAVLQGPSGPVIPRAMVVGPPEALVIGQQKWKEACKAGRSVAFCHRRGSINEHDVFRELAALQPLSLDQRTVPGPPEDLRPWLI